jgi:hypothetical protein
LPKSNKINFIFYFNNFYLQHKLSRCDLSADNIAAVFAHQCIADIDTENVEAQFTVGLIFVEARTEDPEVPFVVGCNYLYSLIKLN